MTTREIQGHLQDHHWREALNHFTLLWPERMPALERA